jgi:heterodisulfide reductase subunit C
VNEMMWPSIISDGDDFITKIISLSQQNVFLCNICGKCTAGCPIATTMDIKPHEVIRLVQMGEKNVLNAKTIWLCASCLICASRCPRKIDLPKVMEALRTTILASGFDFLKYNSDLSEYPLQALVAARSKFSSVGLPTIQPYMRLSRFFVQSTHQV